MVCPGCSEIVQYGSDEYIDCGIASIASTFFRPCRTMGALDNKDTVVTPDLKVKYINKLIVINGSVISILPSCKILLLVMAIEKK